MKDDRLTVFVISWILMLRGSNHAKATIEDLYVLKAFKENIQVDWLAAISDNMLKVTRLESVKLSYCVFISKILIHFGVDYIGESSESYNRTSLINKDALHKIRMQHTPEGWRFKDEITEEGDEAGQSSSIPYRARSEFERTLLREINPFKIMCQETRIDVLEIKEHLKLNNIDEDQLAKEGSTPDDSDGMEEDENVFEESNSDMLLGTYL
ncbi:hypothetical protein LR48_Vigan661s003600 [Vigna angularis]|uniref:Uncharacterized protein n=1 Tax=Phaseolus angularis TaxID=3914 RepID=A0A0L9TGY3_PHAAN|nr:hypothetical protein LR48_Vigan661s003600 [Vigna angularis]